MIWLFAWLGAGLLAFIIGMSLKSFSYDEIELRDSLTLPVLLVAGFVGLFIVICLVIADIIEDNNFTIIKRRRK